MLVSTMSHDEFTRLFKYMQSFRADVDRRFDKVEGDISDIKLGVAEFGSQIKGLREEVKIIGHNDSRQNRWVRELADHTGTKLSPA